jgi:two-component system NtrC family sensor kinase
MAVIGQLVAGIAHEINTPLASIRSNIDIEKMILEMVKSDVPESVEDFKKTVQEFIEVNTMAMERIIEIVKGLKNFARLDEAEVQVVDIHEGINSTLLLIKNQSGNRIEIVKDYGKIPYVKCYPQQINQVLLNILVNAIQAINDNGFVTIKTYQEGNNIVISISDTGVGIKEENISKIFEPGFTTKGVGVGTGLGLSISYKIMKKHNGELKVISKKGEGTTFFIELPIEHKEFDEEVSL